MHAGYPLKAWTPPSQVATDLFRKLPYKMATFRGFFGITAL